MHNVKMSVQAGGDALVIHVSLKPEDELGPSSTGKTILVGTTRGPWALPLKDGYFVAVNVFRKREGK